MVLSDLKERLNESKALATGTYDHAEKGFSFNSTTEICKGTCSSTNKSISQPKQREIKSNHYFQNKE